MSKVNYKKMLTEIDKIVSQDWGYSVTDAMVNLPDGTYDTFTQEQAVEMSKAISRVYMIAHAVHCEACQSNWKATSNTCDTNQKILEVLERLEGEAVEVTPVMYNRPFEGGVVVGVQNSAVPLSAIQEIKAEYGGKNFEKNQD